MLVAVIFAAAVRIFADTILGDFTVTFYRAAGYLLHGEDVYFGKYPNPLNGRDYPPYSPIWVVFPTIPFTMLPLDVAEALRFLLDIASVPLLAYIAARWAHLNGVRYSVVLALAPWYLIFIFAGNYSVVVFVGILLCYWGVRHPDAWMIAVGLVFLTIKPHIVLLVILATLIYAWRNNVLVRSVGLFLAVAVVSSLSQPTWIFDAARLLIQRLARPRFADAVLLLPWYPWSQLAVLAIGVLFLIVYVWKSRAQRPTVWLWCVLACVSLVGALHSFPYDWLNLMLPLAWLLGQRNGVFLVVATYLYVFVWLISEFVFGIRVPPVTAIPLIVTIGLLVWRPILSWNSAATVESEGRL